MSEILGVLTFSFYLELIVNEKTCFPNHMFLTKESVVFTARILGADTTLDLFFPLQVLCKLTSSAEICRDLSYLT